MSHLISLYRFWVEETIENHLLSSSINHIQRIYSLQIMIPLKIKNIFITANYIYFFNFWNNLFSFLELVCITLLPLRASDTYLLLPTAPNIKLQLRDLLIFAFFCGIAYCRGAVSFSFSLDNFWPSLKLPGFDWPLTGH